MATESTSSDGQVSEATNLRGDAGEAEIQQDEGAPPAAEADQEDQSRIEAEISPDETDHAVARAEGREQD